MNHHSFVTMHNVKVFIILFFSALTMFSANDPGQMVLILLPHQDANQGQLYKFEKRDGQWSQIGPEHAITIGANGVAWSESPHAPANARYKVEGDKRSPAGIFSLKQTFGRASDQKAQYLLMPYQQIGPNAQCIEDNTSAYYNQIVFDNTQVVPDWTQDDRMLRTDNLYDWGVFVEVNTDKTPGKGSCIFIHIWRGSDKPTAGCTAMSKRHLTQLVYWLDPVKDPQMALMTQQDYNRLKGALDLPVLK